MLLSIYSFMLSLKSIPITITMVVQHAFIEIKIHPGNVSTDDSSLRDFRECSECNESLKF